MQQKYFTNQKISFMYFRMKIELSKNTFFTSDKNHYIICKILKKLLIFLIITLLSEKKFALE